ncbi:HEPN/Toprim-associated domain-containing protein [Micromonospora costi]|uniref:HEPN/Toprim-associated domain-containing protein n=1 Tax=Micromonospora costi TaxID=1530042 RepID=UPI0011C461A1|nr:HEPN/Toprim-associated domain-containing protein [Micromonospora costi]
MGDRWRLYLSGDLMMLGKNELPIKLLTLFQEPDKYVHSRWAAWLEGDDRESERDLLVEPPSDTSGFFGYKARVGVVRRRLDLMGFTVAKCERRLVESLEEFRRDDGVDKLVSIGRGGAVEKFEASCQETLRIGLGACVEELNGRGNGLSRLQKAALQEIDIFFDLYDDQRMLLSLLLDGQNANKVLRLDLHDLLGAGYFTRNESITSTALQELAEETASSGSIIVVTEGRFDARVLLRALQLVRPDVAGYFRFLDFDSTNMAGGTDRVVHNMKSFAAAGVMNRVVALLDNDAAGRMAETELIRLGLPTRFQVCRLPDLEYVRSYPTLGPSGGRFDDLNGRACSIEFYFGRDCLKDLHGAPIPVRWSSFNPKVQDYQGELTNKAIVQKNIEEALARARPSDVAGWEGIRRVADTLVAAAHSAS